MIKRNSETNKMIIKIGPIEMDLKSFAILVSGIIMIVFIIKSGYEFNVGNWSCNGKPADVKVTIEKMKNTNNH